MWYLISEIWLLLLISFLLGWWAHWLLCCRSNNQGNDSIQKGETDNNTEASTTDIDNNWKPEGFANQPDNIDDLKRIKGVGSVIEETLHGLGIYQFQQIARWDSNNIAWIENLLSFPGRIEREDWIDQARTLSAGETTEFAERVDKGDIDYGSTG